MKVILKLLKKPKFLKIALPFGLAISTTGYIAASVVGANFFTTSFNRTLPPVTPASIGLTYEDITFQSKAADQLKLQGWWIPKKNSNRVLILLHVKNGDRTFPLMISKFLADNGYNLLLFDLRGHGQSEGSHYSYGQYEQYDVLGAVDFVKARGFQPASIGLMGWSLGAATTIMAMGQTSEIKAAISDSAYGDLARVASQRLGLLSFMLPGIAFSSRQLLNIDLDEVKPENSIKQLGNRHIILIHGTEDVTVPVSEVYFLQMAGGSNVTETWVVPGVGHAGAYERYTKEYQNRVLNFFNQVLG